MSGRLFVMVFVQVEIHRQLAVVDKALVFLRKGRCGCAAVLYVNGRRNTERISEAESTDVHGG